MSETTIEVPRDQLEAIHDTLEAARCDLTDELDRTEIDAASADPEGAAAAARRERLAEIERLLDQIQASEGSGARRLTASRATLWDAVYDSLCAAAERLEQDCNEYWRGELEARGLRARLEDVGARLDLLVSVGSPPGEQHRVDA